MSYLHSLPKKRMGSGALIRNQLGEVLMLQTSYKTVWEIPGGVVEENESPYQACRREVKEEIGVDLQIQQLLCVDYNGAMETKTESLMFIFDGGVFSPTEIATIQVDGKEIVGHTFVALHKLESKTTPSLFRRIKQCVQAIAKQRTYYLENQEQLI